MVTQLCGTYRACDTNTKKKVVQNQLRVRMKGPFSFDRNIVK